MRNSSDSHSPVLSSSDEDAELHTRVQAEFQEMPGLKLTVPQAARLFNLERARCERVLDALVDDGALSCDGRAYGRPGTVAGGRRREPTTNGLASAEV